MCSYSLHLNFVKIPKGVKGFRKNCQGGPPILHFIAFLLTSFSKICLGGSVSCPPPPLCASMHSNMIDQTWPKCGPPNFFGALEVRGAHNFCNRHYLKCHFWRNFWLFFPKKWNFWRTFLEPLVISQICREIFKKFWTPLPPGMNLQPQEH